MLLNQSPCDSSKSPMCSIFDACGGRTVTTIKKRLRYCVVISRSASCNANWYPFDHAMSSMCRQRYGEQDMKHGYTRDRFITQTII